MNRRFAVIGAVAVLGLAIAPKGADAARTGRVSARGVVTSVTPASATVSPGTAATSLPSAATAALGAGARYRRVSDVVREALAAASVNRSGPVTAAAVDSRLLRLASDATAYLDADNRLLFIDDFGPAPEKSAASDEFATDPVLAPIEAPPQASTGAEPVTANGVVLPGSGTFALNSRLGSTKTIYLDFDGYTGAGPAWAVGAQPFAPYDFDGLPGLSASDEDAIRRIWQAVAEDYAPFDVNVTTQLPTPDRLYKTAPSDVTYGSTAVITPTRLSTGTCTGSCTGVAYVGIFGVQGADANYSPAWAFAGNSSQTSAQSVADTISHEVGHNFDLSHDAVSPCTPGSFLCSYYTGHGSGSSSWGPIMGSPYLKTYTQWSKGEYLNPSNTEDDVAIIGGKTGYLVDASNSIGNAVSLPTDESVTTDQIIGFNGDVDYFSIPVTTGYLRAFINRSSNGSDLYARLAILNSAGTELTFGILQSGTGGWLEVTGLAPAMYYVSVAGSSLGSPQNGFSSYASSGFYNVAAQTFATPSTPGSPSLVATGSQALTAAWAGSATMSPLAPITYAVSLCDAVSAVCSAPIDTTATSLVLTSPTPTGSYVARVNARHIAGRVSANATSAAATVLTAPIAPTPFSLSFNELTDTVTIAWAGEQQFAPVVVTGRTLTVVNRSTGLTVLSDPSIPATGSRNFTTLLADVWLDASIRIDASIVSPTGSPPPSSLPFSWPAVSPFGSVFLGRPPAPQAAGPAGGLRQSAPQSVGTTVPGRPAAPQA